MSLPSARNGFINRYVFPRRGTRGSRVPDLPHARHRLRGQARGEPARALRQAWPLGANLTRTGPRRSVRSARAPPGCGACTWPAPGWDSTATTSSCTRCCACGWRPTGARACRCGPIGNSPGYWPASRVPGRASGARAGASGSAGRIRGTSAGQRASGRGRPRPAQVGLQSVIAPARTAAATAWPGPSGPRPAGRSPAGRAGAARARAARARPRLRGRPGVRQRQGPRPPESRRRARRRIRRPGPAHPASDPRSRSGQPRGPPCAIAWANSTGRVTCAAAASQVVLRGDQAAGDGGDQPPPGRREAGGREDAPHGEAHWPGRRSASEPRCRGPRPGP